MIGYASYFACQYYFTNISTPPHYPLHLHTPITPHNARYRRPPMLSVTFMRHVSILITKMYVLYFVSNVHDKINDNYYVNKLNVYFLT